MGLSYYTNWETIQHHNQDMGLFIQHSAPTPPPLPDLIPELLTFHDDLSLDDTCIDPLFNPSPHDDDPSLLSHPNLLYPLPEIFPSVLLDSSTSTYNFHYYPKRQKTSHHDDHYNNNNVSHDYFGGVLLDATTTDLGDNGFFLPIMNPEERPIWLPYLPLEPLSPPHHQEFQTTTRTCDQDHALPAVNSCASISCIDFQETTSSSSTCVKKAANASSSSAGTLSAQSMAARLRRKKITDKTRELGKLIPGGHKMNTAEMFQAASKYIKFLQAQVGVLQHMPTIQGNEGAFDEKEFQALVTSHLVQENFYAAEKCLVPKKLVESILANDHQFQSKPQLFKDINELIKKIH